MNDWSKRLAQLPPEKQAILAQEIEKDGARFNCFRLSFAQERLWFLEQLAPGNPTYTIPGALRIRGPLDLEALRQSFQEMVIRHEILRTVFFDLDGRPLQVIQDRVELPLTVLDLREYPEEQQKPQAQQLASEESRRPFDLREGPLLRTLLLQLSEQEYILVVTMHHIISDGWSLGVLIHELSQLYPAFVQGQESPLPELPIQYADYATWQRQRLQGTVLEEQLDYWKETLAGAPAMLELPTDHARPAQWTFRGARQPLHIPAELTEQLKQFSRREGVTLFMTLLTAFGVLLARYSDQDDLLIGSPIANRNRREVEGLIGFFVNTLVLRCDLRGSLSFREAVQRVREMALGAYAHQELPFEKLVEVLQPERNLSHQALFQVMFALQNAPTPVLQLPGMQLSIMEIDNRVSRFDLALTLEETTQGLYGWFEYSTDLFEGERMERMGQHYQRLLEALVAAPEQRIADLPLLSEPERLRLLHSWNATRVDFGPPLCIHRLIEQQAAQRPLAVAVVCGEERVSYAELNRRANQLAHL
ncbi:MAG: condensation domain-containing protein, partial [Ktedonobacteraceae bacterium]